MIERLTELLEKSCKDGLNLEEVKEISPLLAEEVRKSIDGDHVFRGLSLGLILFKASCIILDSMESEKKRNERCSSSR